VVDSGPGVPPEVAQTLFEPFRRGNTVRPGLGLGLAISRSLARQMGGDLNLVPSTSGAAFRLVVDSPTCSPPPRSEVLNLSGKRILVVDDVATNRMVAAGLLRTLGAEVVGAASGAEALKLLDESTVDLVWWREIGRGFWPERIAGCGAGGGRGAQSGAERRGAGAGGRGAQRPLPQSGLPRGPFRGVPFLLKDLGCEAVDFPSHNGSRLFGEHGLSGAIRRSSSASGRPAW
jgi:hypothetical protein